MSAATASLVPSSEFDDFLNRPPLRAAVKWLLYFRFPVREGGGGPDREWLMGDGSFFFGGKIQKKLITRVMLVSPSSHLNIGYGANEHKLRAETTILITGKSKIT